MTIKKYEKGRNRKTRNQIIAGIVIAVVVSSLSIFWSWQMRPILYYHIYQVQDTIPTKYEQIMIKPGEKLNITIAIKNTGATDAPLNVSLSLWQGTFETRKITLPEGFTNIPIIYNISHTGYKSAKTGEQVIETKTLKKVNESYVYMLTYIPKDTKEWVKYALPFHIPTDIDEFTIIFNVKKIFEWSISSIISDLWGELHKLEPTEIRYYKTANHTYVPQIISLFHVKAFIAVLHKSGSDFQMKEISLVRLSDLVEMHIKKSQECIRKAFGHLCKL